MPELTEGNTDDPIVATYEIRKSFDKFEALKGITLSVSSGQVVCIVGPSGGGKSTFLRTLNGLETIDEGRIVITGVQLPGTKKDVQNVRREVGMVFQSFNLFGHMSVRDNITALPPLLHAASPGGRPMSGQKKLLERVGIEDQIDKYPSQLSGGQQQRVAIARALAMEPPRHDVRRSDLGPRSGK